ncbi:MAG TPA: zinc ribbon domain-containing protein [Sedimentisphaerales bacterium]|nr:zinc ribbon domain-containing protein [Sedimentisphaerales bacterium]HRS12949.1 zinc ribbon domain-containing protein [Sedimentisphaerales bacterium]HRV49554.1 zinc ribbon domain-containing protein [Sedimentisphaerales bacterium]
MPIFEYRCEQCGHVMEVLQTSRKATRQTCAKCGSTSMKKLLSAFAVGQSKAASGPACDSCAAGPACGMDSCPGGACPMA